MKPFNLEEALSGKPVVLRDGSKAIVLSRIPDTYKLENGLKVTFPLFGIILNTDGTVDDPYASWRDNGMFASCTSDYDIVGMWEDVIDLKDLPKAFMPKLGEYYYRITSKTIFDTLNIREKRYSDPEYDDKAVNQGNCFRTREDAQKWLNFMESMKE